MKEQVIYQEVTLDITDVLSENYIGNKEVEQTLKDFLIEGYNPLIDQLAQLANENPEMNIQDNRVVKILNDFQKLLKDIGYVDQAVEKNNSNNNSMPTHLDLICDSIKKGESIGKILKSFEESLVMQTKKDFEDGRIQPILIDQDGKEFYFNNNPSFNEALKKKAEEEKTDFKEAFKKALNLSDEQFNCLLCRFNQRALEGGALAFVDTSKFNISNKERKNIFYVDVEKDNEGNVIDGKIKKTKAVENISRIDHLEMTDDDVEFIPIAYARYKIDLDIPHAKFNRSLPIYKTEEKFSYQALNEDAVYDIPEILKERTENNKLLSFQEELTDEQVKSLIFSPHILDELTEANYQVLVDQVTPEIVEDIIKKQHEKICSEEINAKNSEIAEKLQNNLAQIFACKELVKDKEFKTMIFNFVEQQKPSALTQVRNYLHAAYHLVSIENYKERKLEKIKKRVEAKVLSRDISNSSFVGAPIVQKWNNFKSLFHSQ